MLITSFTPFPGLPGGALDARVQQDIVNSMIALQHASPDARIAPRGLASLIAIPPDLRNGLAPMVRELAEYGLARIQLSDASLMRIVVDLMNTPEAGGIGPPDGWDTTKRVDEWGRSTLELDQDGHVIWLRFDTMGAGTSLLRWVCHLSHLKSLVIANAGSAIPSSIAQLTALRQLTIFGATDIPPEN